MVKEKLVIKSNISFSNHAFKRILQQKAFFLSVIKNQDYVA